MRFMLICAYALIISKFKYRNRIIRNDVCVLNKVNNGVKGPYNGSKWDKTDEKGLQIVFFDKKYLTAKSINRIYVVFPHMWISA